MARASILLAAAIAFGLAAPSAQAQNVQAGTLNCDVSGGIGLIITSQRQMACTFSNSRGELEVYTGTITRFGLDIGATAGGQLVWQVFAPSGAVVRGALQGAYTGASAEATAGVGLQGNILLGGSNRSVALQPLSAGGQVGLNIAAGVATLELRAGQPVPVR